MFQQQQLYSLYAKIVSANVESNFGFRYCISGPRSVTNSIKNLCNARVNDDLSERCHSRPQSPCFV